MTCGATSAWSLSNILRFFPLIVLTLTQNTLADDGFTAACYDSNTFRLAAGLFLTQVTQSSASDDSRTRLSLPTPKVDAMPPPMPNPQKRMTANPARPVQRYRPGKAIAAESLSSEDEDDDGAEAQNQQPPKTIPKATSFFSGVKRNGEPTSVTSRPQRRLPEDNDEEGFVTEEEDEEERDSKPEATRPSEIPDTRPGEFRGVVDRSESEDEEDETEHEGSTEEESSSSDEAPQRILLRPTFIKKSARKDPSASVTPAANGQPPVPSTTASSITAVESYRTAEEEERRREMADLMIRDKLERDAAARAAGKKSWDDDDEVAPEDMVDDTDGVDPEAELAAWKLRELKRLKRDRETIEVREKELEEIERRRNLSKEEREREDAEFLGKQKAEQEGKGKAGFMQKYHHRGAFFQDDLAKEGLDRRDLMGAHYVDEVKNREALPEFMQIRDMAKLGRKGRSKYKDLRNEDTGRWGEFRDKRKDMGGFDIDERFRPDRDGGGNRGPTGANSTEVRDRPRRVEGVPDGPRAMRDGERGDTYRPGRRSPDEDDNRASRKSPRRRSRTRSRSRSTRRYRHDDEAYSRKRSSSPYRDRDKRRRVDAI